MEFGAELTPPRGANCNSLDVKQTIAMQPLHFTATGEATGDCVLDSHVSDTMSTTSYEANHPPRELSPTTPLTTDGVQLEDDHSDVRDALSSDLLFEPWPMLVNAAAAIDH